MATQATRTAAASLSEESQAATLHEQITALAHALWEARGCPEGSPEEDWFNAEAQLKEELKAEA